MTAIIRADDERFASLRNIIKNNMKSLAQALPASQGGDQALRRFVQTCINAVHLNPALLSCTPESFFHSIRQSASLGLEPNGALGLAYLIPYGNQCQFQIGYKGLCELARRSGNVRSIYAHCVYPGDEFHYELGLHRDLKHVPAGMTDREALGALSVLSDGEVDPDRPVYAYGVVVLKSGDTEFEVINQRYINSVKKLSRSSNSQSSPWKTFEPAMWKKCAIKQVLKYVSLSPEDVLAKAMESDSALDMSMSLPIDDRKATVKQEVQAVPEIRADEHVAETAETADVPATVASSAKVSEFVSANQAMESAEDRTLPMFQEPENQPRRARRRSE